MNILVSACLLGVCCRWDGGTNGPHPDVEALMKEHNLIPICPEIMGGLPTPRQPSERRGELVATRDYENVTAEFERGAEEALKLCHLYRCRYAILKERSPSCGTGWIYDGTFQGRLVHGYGVTAALLASYGVTVLGESEVKRFRFVEDAP